MNKFGKILADLRLDKGMSQKELAKAFHMSSSTISSYETGTHLPNAEQIVLFADFFGVTTDYILGRSSCNISPSVLKESFVDSTCVQDVISMLSNFPQEHRRALLLIVEEMHFSISMQEQAKAKGG